jgi:hypothetical protein
MSSFGNQDEMDKDFKRLVQKLKVLHPEMDQIKNIDPDVHLTSDYRVKTKPLTQAEKE